eukprot:TRINITY_DN18824_c0_g2_i1.p2 TRINITY_DN18824_c0_g2~~TRINITY_DN18824_c0_g2_i1.p2  ORF type:complete len:355 (+),score=116.65 TRINITY_DN18824_c0_g2_i1:80-1066(+)
MRVARGAAAAGGPRAAASGCGGRGYVVPPAPAEVLRTVAEGAGYAAATVAAGAERAQQQISQLGREATHSLQQAAVPAFAAEQLDAALLAAVRAYTSHIEDSAALEQFARTLPAPLQPLVKQEGARAASQRYLADHNGDVEKACDAFYADCYPAQYTSHRQSAASVGAGGVVEMLEAVTHLRLAAFCAAAYGHDVGDVGVQARILACAAPPPPPETAPAGDEGPAAEAATALASGVVASRIRARLLDPFAEPMDGAQVLQRAKRTFGRRAAEAEAEGSGAAEQDAPPQAPPEAPAAEEAPAADEPAEAQSAPGEEAGAGGRKKKKGGD